MADPRFFSVQGPFSLADLARISQGRLSPGSDPERIFCDVAPLDSAGPSDVSFLDNRRYRDAFAASRAGACIAAPEVVDKAPAGMALLLSDKPYKAYAQVARAFYPRAGELEVGNPGKPIDPTASLGEGTKLGSGVVIGSRAEIGRRCVIGDNAVIGAGVVLGDDCVIGPGATLSHCVAGARVVIEAGARVGQEGFGFAMAEDGHTKVPQLGRVVIHDDAEIGANTTVDRGSGSDTVIGPGCMIDNLVQIAHNVQLGRGCVIAAQVGISGSTKLEDYVVVGGQAGFAGHLRIGRGTRVAAKSGVTRDVPAGATFGGFPAMPARQWHRQSIALARLAEKKRKDE